MENPRNTRTILETSVSENKVANRKIFETSAIRKLCSDENWIRLGSSSRERRNDVHESPFTVLVEKELLICANHRFQWALDFWHCEAKLRSCVSPSVIMLSLNEARHRFFFSFRFVFSNLLNVPQLVNGRG